MLHFATLFDINYLSRGLALLDSLTKHSSQSFKLYILALDARVISYFEKHPNSNVTTISLDEIEKHFPELLKAKNNRSVIEYYFTLSPYLPSYILEKYPDVEQITTMDADIYFFNDPAIILKKYPLAAVLITPHNFSPALQYLEVYGKYNVSFQSFKNNDAARLCLQSWRQDCFNWCHDFFDEANNRFADQKYLDEWKEKFEQVEDIGIPGAGLAPWNIEKYNYEFHKDHMLVNHHPLIYYHFHHLRIFNKNFAFNGLEIYQVQTKRKAIRAVYHIYLKKLNSFAVKQTGPDSGTLRYNSLLKNGTMQKFKNPDGYWFFSNYAIIHVNPHRRLKNLKRMLRSLWPNS